MCEDSKQNMEDYDLNVVLTFSTTDEEDEFGDYLEFANWKEGIYFEGNEPFGINDKNDWNVMVGRSNNKKLDKQKHCWLLHQLYDNHFVSWENILRIDRVWFEIVTEQEYAIKFKELQNDKK